MGIERPCEEFLKAWFEASCKKSPQAWGLKGPNCPNCPNFFSILQKESPSMGIERSSKPDRLSLWKRSTCKKSPQAWGLKVVLWYIVVLVVLMACKKSPQAWGLKGRVSRGKHHL